MSVCLIRLEIMEGHRDLCPSMPLALGGYPVAIYPLPHWVLGGGPPRTHPTSSSSGSGGSGELGERSRSRTEGLLRIQARQIGYSGVFSLN